MVEEWQDQRTEKELNQDTMEREMKAMVKAVQKINMPLLGHTHLFKRRTGSCGYWHVRWEGVPALR